jgi:hypothetical protein
VDRRGRSAVELGGAAVDNFGCNDAVGNGLCDINSQRPMDVMQYTCVICEYFGNWYGTIIKMWLTAM